MHFESKHSKHTFELERCTQNNTKKDEEATRARLAKQGPGTLKTNKKQKQRDKKERDAARAKKGIDKDPNADKWTEKIEDFDQFLERVETQETSYTKRNKEHKTLRKSIKELPPYDPKLELIQKKME